MLEQDAKQEVSEKKGKRAAPTKDQQLLAAQHRIKSLEIELEEMKQNPPIPTKEKMAEAMKADSSLIPEFVKPVIPVPQQTKFLTEIEELLGGIVTNVESVKGLAQRLKKGIRTPPMGR